MMDAQCSPQQIKEEVSNKKAEESIETEEEFIECFKCNGKKLNKKGFNCKMCKGSGKLNNKFMLKLQKMLSKEVKQFCAKKFENFKKKKEEIENQPKAIHFKYICDGCNANPIVGIRYRCTVRPNFDLCEKCEQRPQPYPMIKIREPSQTPINVMCQYKEFPCSASQASEMPKLDLNEVNEFNKKMEEKVSSEYSESPSFYIFKAKCLEHPLSFNVVQPDQEVTLCWTFTNEGEKAWPKDTTFGIVSGWKDINLQPILMTEKIEPSMNKTIKIRINAPSEAGQYNLHFRLAYDNGRIQFGDKSFVTLQVEDKCVALPSDNMRLSMIENFDPFAFPEEMKKPEEDKIEDQIIEIPNDLAIKESIPDMLRESGLYEVAKDIEEKKEFDFEMARSMMRSQAMIDKLQNDDVDKSIELEDNQIDANSCSSEEEAVIVQDDMDKCEEVEDLKTTQINFVDAMGNSDDEPIIKDEPS